MLRSSSLGDATGKVKTSVRAKALLSEIMVRKSKRAAIGPRSRKPAREAVAEAMSNRLSLKALRNRAAVSAEEAGKAVGLKPSGYTRYEDTRRFDAVPIPARIILKMIPLLVGKGNPPIRVEELLIISELRIINTVLRPSEQKPTASVPAEGSENMPHSNALVQKYIAERGAYREVAKAAAGIPSRRLSPIFALRSYPQDRQWACVVLDDHAAGLGFPPGTTLHCVDADAVPRMKLQVGSIVVALHKRGDLGEVVVCYVSDLPPNGIVVKLADGTDCNPCDILGVALYVYGPVTLHT